MTDDKPKQDKKEPLVHRRGAAREPRERRERRAVPPKETHGTQVRFNVVCAHCGAEDTLPFVPKTTGAMLCRKCAAEVFGPDWARGRTTEKEERQAYPFNCTKCGREATVPFEPRPEHDLLCKACMRGEEQPRLDRLKRMKKVE